MTRASCPSVPASIRGLPAVPARRATQRPPVQLQFEPTLVEGYPLQRCVETLVTAISA